MTLHPQIAAFAAQLDDLSRLLRAQGARPWADRIDLIQRAVADSNYAGVTRFRCEAIRMPGGGPRHGAAAGPRRRLIRL
jgi:hypothetical protein